MIDRACISLGEKCNLKCAYCHFHNENNGKLSGIPQEFTTDELIKIAKNLNDYAKTNNLSIFKIGIVGSGEPTLQYRKIVGLIEYVKNNNLDRLAFYTITNGTILKDKMLNFFLEHKNAIKMCFSLDGYEELHNLGREKYNVVFNGVKEYESKFGYKPPINCTVHSQTILNKTKLRAYLEDNNFKDVTFSRLFDSHDLSMTISKDQYQSLLEYFRGSQFEVRQLDENNKKKYDCTMYGTLCGVGRTNIFITKRGIYPCGRFYGNENYNYGAFDMDLENLEFQMGKMKSLEDGECYYDKYVEIR
ncbi:Anaerobic sulfatase-maturating enzyme [Vibrio aerogenes CECT 7868]|uniref:Anaerobic sulfatase-maturating enzyme n=1 Tax=Vibrio aerogenes CECT 7868 TaxID=1216006 RepID=A0A1M6B0C8_9VIBR|nr:radical SAM protein [Vibrio aerogenes]SHI41923.1 Anaerobic sulfatase-maturating enzyme [Vibrio aerogenes CECT 7868]